MSGFLCIPQCQTVTKEVKPTMKEIKQSIGSRGRAQPYEKQPQANNTNNLLEIEL